MGGTVHKRAHTGRQEKKKKEEEEEEEEEEEGKKIVRTDRERG